VTSRASTATVIGGVVVGAAMVRVPGAQNATAANVKVKAR
jgi:hypothetical protein